MRDVMLNQYSSRSECSVLKGPRHAQKLHRHPRLHFHEMATPVKHFLRDGIYLVYSSDRSKFLGARTFTDTEEVVDMKAFPVSTAVRGHPSFMCDEDVNIHRFLS